jgi:O-antigen/teichoic acid export membrane protein
MSLSTELVNVIYGADYKLATLYLPIYISIFLSTGLGCRIMESFFNGIGETKLTLKIYLANLAIFIPLAPILTKFYGIPGFIVALPASNLASTLYGLALAKRKLQVNIGLTGQLKIYISSILSALPTLVFLQFSNLTNILNLLIASAIFLITYFTLTPILKSVNQSDLQNLKQIFEKIRVLWPIIKLAIDYEGKILAIIVHLNKKGN